MKAYKEDMNLAIFEAIKRSKKTLYEYLSGSIYSYDSGVNYHIFYTREKDMVYRFIVPDRKAENSKENRLVILKKGYVVSENSFPAFGKEFFENEVVPFVKEMEQKMEEVRSFAGKEALEKLQKENLRQEKELVENFVSAFS